MAWERQKDWQAPQPAYGQYGLEWLPKKSPARAMNWQKRQQPIRLRSVSYSQPTNYQQCFNCFEEALWYCDACKMRFCRFDECKEIHEYEHTLSRLGGVDSEK